ncbi:aminoglycoside adenylyltransferase domain-containing protein [Streptomyces shenzhenensis]|uniref:Translation initiation factor 2 n=1 Tax=Streptomyces shenzhenensis TaxID=943815 RepID=A0A3M0I8V5_9ACTN|nr:aminoglycoside adenylyltransferase domain-containing protein [Streptomyces shenzhenensis]RMB85275.1 translation initiation factor 2 [Streptomyces shenzhenensis]
MIHTLGEPRAVPAEVRGYLEELVRRTSAVCGPRLVSVVGVGSLALGDYRHGRSDLDITVVVDPALPRPALHDLAETLAHPRLPCPAAGLELVVYAADAAARPSGAAGYLLDLNTGALLPDRAAFDTTGSPSFWYVIDRSVAHQCGIPLFGRPAREAIAAPPPAELLTAIRASLREHSDGEGHLADNRVLNGCRSVVFCRTGRWSAKRAAAHEIAAAEADFRPLVEAAVRSFERPRASAEPLPGAAVRAFLGWARERVDGTARAAGN